MLFSTVGLDESGGIISGLLAEQDISNDLKIGKNSETITKTRILTNDQQLCRIDSGHIKASPPSFGASPAAIIVSDYGKGTITTELLDDLINIKSTSYKGIACPILFDTKGTDWEKY